jgi:CubicO group peptidase (beta-lactamase class C family)
MNAMPSWTSLAAYYPQWIDYRRWYARVPGVQVAIRRAGEVELAVACGVADLDSGEPLRDDHLFRIASHSKSLAAVLVLQLVERRALRLDDPLGAHVPELAGAPVADRTVGELLSHSGGVIRDSEDGDFWQGLRAFPDRAELIDIATAASSAVLGRHDHFKYSNIAFGLIGLVLESVTGKTFAQLVRSAIADPLGLTDLGGEYETARAEQYAAGHTSVALTRERTTIPHVDTRALAAATGCYATATDLTAFFGALLPGYSRLLSADSVRLLRHQQWEVREGEQHYALGLFLDRVAETDLFGHTGGYPGHVTCTFADAKDQRVVSVFVNCIDGPVTALARGWFLLQTLGRKAEHAPCTIDAARFTGRFATEWGLLDVAQVGDHLFSIDPTDEDPADGAVPLEIVDDATLRIAGGHGTNSYGESMRYTFAADGQVELVRGESGMSMHPFALPG